MMRRSQVAGQGPAADSADLHRLLLKGDEQAFRQLIRLHHRNMIGLARAFVTSRASAEEVVQDTWVAVLDGIGKLDQPASLKPWIYAILVNKARTRAVRERRMVPFTDMPAGAGSEGPAVDPGRFDGAGNWTDPPCPWGDLGPERVVAGRQLWGHVMQAIDDLPPAQRAVIILHDLEGQEAADICHILGITAGNQRVLLHRARAKLRQLVETLVTPRPPAGGQKPGRHR